MSTPAIVPVGPSSSEDPGRATLRGRPFHSSLLVAFLVLLNLVAMWGQAGWFREHLTNHNGWEDWLPALGVALVVELVGVFLAGMAHATLMANQSAGVLRAGSYAVGLLVGALNFAHFAGPSGDPNATAITFGALSAISPWLWAIYSRYMHRDKLAELGLVDARGVKLSVNRKFWHPIKSVQVMSFAAWSGITDPEAAVRAWETRNNPEEVPEQLVEWYPVSELTSSHLPEAPVSPAPTSGGRWTSRELVAAADAYAKDVPGATQAEVAAHLGVSDSRLRQARRAVKNERSGGDIDGDPGE